MLALSTRITSKGKRERWLASEPKHEARREASFFALMMTLQIGLATVCDASAKSTGLGAEEGETVLVSINMAMSLDGKIATKARGPMKLGTELDSRRMWELRAENDAVINGAGTFRAYPFPLLVKDPALVEKRKQSGMSAHPISAIVSSRLSIKRNTPWEKSEETERWAFCGNRTPEKTALSLAKSGVKVIRTRSETPSPKEILAAFGKAGVKRLLVEGGGELNASFLEKGLVQRVHLTLTNCVVGGRDSPTWVEGKGFPLKKFPRFRLTDCRREADELFLTYER